MRYWQVGSLNSSTILFGNGGLSCPCVLLRIKRLKIMFNHWQVGGKGFQGNQTEEEGLVNRSDSSDEEDSSFDLIN